MCLHAFRSAQCCTNLPALHSRNPSQSDFVFTYIDDLLIASSSEGEHLHYLELLFARLTTYDVVIQPSNCVFGVTTLEFLGHTISETGIAPLDSKVTVIREFLLPISVRKIQEFLCLVNFYC